MVTDLKQNVVWADGPYRYELGEMISGELREFSGLELLVTDHGMAVNHVAHGHESHIAGIETRGNRG